MKEFLYNKYSTYNQDTVDQFQQKITNLLPTFNRQNVYDCDLAVWGFEAPSEHGNAGYWWMTQHAITYLEDGGFVHQVGERCTPQVYQIWSDLFLAAQENNPGFKVLQPLVSENLILEDVNHPGYQYSDNGKICYQKYDTTLGGFGFPPWVDSKRGAFVFDDAHVKKWIDWVHWTLSILKKKGHMYPKTGFTLDCWVRDPDVAFLLLRLPVCETTDINEAIEVHMEALTHIFEASAVDNYHIQLNDINELNRYARTLWSQLTI